MTTTSKDTDVSAGKSASDSADAAAEPTTAPAADKPVADRPDNPLPSMGRLITEGMSAVRRYKGLAIALYTAQLVTALILTWAISSMLAAAFADQPMFDMAVDGDVAALIFLIVDEPWVTTSILYAVIATTIGYWLVSWYLLGGLNRVLVERPSARGDVVKQFGIGGARTFFGYARLTLLSLVPYAVISGVLLYGLSSASDELRYGLTFGDVFWAVVPRIAPGLLLLMLHTTAVDYARVELSRTIGLASRHALWRAYRTIISDWRPLVHVGAYIAFFAIVSWLYVVATQGAPMHGAGGAIVLFLIRQLLSIVRFAGKLTCAGGQVVYADARNRDDRPKKRLPVVA